MKSIFQKIIDREIPADIVFEDDRVIAFRDIEPQAPVHLLVIPKQSIRSLAEATEDDCSLLGYLLWVAGEVARREGIAQSGYRIVTNIGSDGGQSVAHLHFHVLGSRKLSWPPG